MILVGHLSGPQKRYADILLANFDLWMDQITSIKGEDFFRKTPALEEMGESTL